MSFMEKFVNSSLQGFNFIYGAARVRPRPSALLRALSLPKRHRTRLARRFKRSCGVRTRLRYHNKKTLHRSFNYTQLTSNPII